MWLQTAGEIENTTPKKWSLPNNVQMTLARRFIWSFLHNHADGKIHPGSKKFSGDLSYEKKNNDFQI